MQIAAQLTVVTRIVFQWQVVLCQLQLVPQKLLVRMIHSLMLMGGGKLTLL